MNNSTRQAKSSVSRIIFLAQKTKAILITSLIVLASIIGFTQQAEAQAVLHSVGTTTVCQGESATMAISVASGAKPYVVVYTDGTSNFTINSYNSDENSEDLITVSPSVTKTYSLVSVTCCGGISMDPISGSVTLTVNPLPTNIIVSPSTRVCPNVDFTISATATNGNTYELWNAANTTKIGNLPYTANIASATNYTVRAISSAGCTTLQAYQVLIENTPPTITCPGNQNLNTNIGNCNATLPDYTSLATASDNCTATGSIVKTQSPVAGTILTGGHNSTQLVTITATDVAGNSQNCSFTVTVKDTELPVISGSATSGSKNTDSGQCYYTVSGTEFNPTTLTDNCGILKLTYKINSGTEVGTNSSTSLAGVQLAKGANTILWKAYDINGNANTWSFVITVADDQNPTFMNCPANRDLNMDIASCNATIPDYISLLGIAATDNCGAGSVVLTQSPLSGTTLVGGNGVQQLITITATDASGKSSTCTFTVTVKDSQLPTISCPSNISVNVDSGMAGAIVTYTAPVGSDNCAGATTVQTAGLVSGSTFPVGVTTNTFKVTDAIGNENVCSFTVTVADNEFPEIACPENVTIGAAPGTCGAVVNYETPVGTDALPGAVTVQTAGLASGSTFPVGTTTNTFEVTDASGNKTSCSFTVKVNDTENPTIVNLPPNIEKDNDINLCGAVVSWTAPTSADNCSGSSIAQTAGLSSGSVFPVGTSTVTYTATDGAGNTHSESFTVKVKDTQSPVISGCPTTITRSSGAGVCTAVVSWTEPTATDNCTSSGSLVWTKSHTPGSVFPIGTTTVTYTVADGATPANTTTCSFDVVVVDSQKPVITGCPSNITADAGSGCSAIVNWTEPTATDNCTSTDNLVWIKNHYPGETFPVGTTIVTYTVKDLSNNVSNQCSFTITVTDNSAPTVSTKPATIYLNSSGIATLSVADVDNGSYDNCTPSGNLIMTLSKTSFNCSNIGANSVTLTVKDAGGKSSSSVVTVNVVDNTQPTISATSGTVNSTINTSTGLCKYTINGAEFDPTVTDNCIGTVLYYSVSGATTIGSTAGSMTGVQLNKGINVVTWTATDASGNVSDTPLSFTKTVQDMQPPVISAKTNQNRGTDTGCGYTAKDNEFDVTVTENCSGFTLTYSINSDSPVVGTTLNGYVFSSGTNEVTWTASDGTNTSTRTFVVKVTDDDAPVITPIANISTGVDPGQCTAVVNWVEPTATDNCGNVTPVQILGLASGSTFPVGTTQIKYRATDATGLYTDMSFTVTVADLTAPMLTCPSGSSETTPFTRIAGTDVCFYTVDGNEFNVTAQDGCSGNIVLYNSFDGTSTLTGKQLPAGLNTITWTASDGVNSSTCTIYVKVNDIQNPTFTQPTGSFARVTDPKQCYFTVPGTEFDLSNVSDNCSTQTPSYIISKNGTEVFSGLNTLAGLKLPKDAANAYSVVWTLKDLAGNTVVSTPFTISVTDNQAPSFVCYGNELRTIAADECKYIINGNEFDPTGLTDNCDASGDLSISFTINGNSGGASTSLAGRELFGGVYTVVWTVIDKSNNSATCTFKITITDPVLPIISPIANQVKDAPATDCGYTTSGSEFDPTVSDNCASPTLTNNLNGSSTLAGYKFPVGITIVTWKATDASDNVSTLQYSVTVNDLIPPDYTIPATVTKSASGSGCHYTVNGTEFDPQGISDNCTSANYTIINNYNQYRSLAYVDFPVGTTTVEWSVKDNYGNEQKKSMLITVVDDTKPTITCPENPYTRIVDQGQSYYTVGTDEFKPVATDNCSFTYINNESNSSSLNGYHLSPGTHNITWTATDASGNSAFCVVVVNVVSDLYPSITCVGDKSKSNTPGSCSYTVSGTEFDATSTASGAALTNDFNHSASLAGATFPIGTTLVTWTASQTVNGTLYTNRCSFYVFVNDDEVPTVAHDDIILYTSSASSCWVTYTIPTPIPSDNCDVSSIYSNQSGSYYVGTTNVVWTVEDIHGNSVNYIQKVIVIDDDAPQVSCLSSCRQVDSGKGYYSVNGSELDPYWIWDCSGISSITHNISGTPSSTTLAGAQLASGTYNVTWTITDNASPTKNTTTCNSTITINNDDPPSVTCRSSASKNTDAGVCYYTAQGSEFDVTTTSNSSLVFSYTLSGVTSSNGAEGASLSGVRFNRGTTLVQWKAVDGSGNENTCCSFYVYVYDNQPPVVTWPADITKSVDNNSCIATNVDLGAPSAIDNCDLPAAIVYSKNTSATSFAIGTTYVYWTAWDTYGHQVNHTQTITITDNIFPVITCPSTTYYREYNNSWVNYYTVVGSEFTPSVTDNCILSSYTNDLSGTGYLNGVQLSLGNHAIKWTAIDQGGNRDECTVNVFVVESFVPKISCAGNVSRYTATNACTYTVSGTSLDATITPSTGSTNISLTHNFSAPSSSTLDGAVFPKGTTTVVWTAKQTIGGVEYTNTCSQQIVVTDNVPPVFDAFADVVENIDPGTCTKALTLIPPTATDNCTSAGNLIVTSNAPATFILGTTNVRWEVKDESNNLTVYIQKVTVTDNQGPVIENCPSAALTAYASGANCQAIVSWPPLVATDACSGVESFTSDHFSGSFYPVGTTSVTYTATDKKGNKSYCTFDVIVTDELPSISCVGNQTRSTDSGLCSYKVLGNEFDPISFADQCGIKSITWSFIDNSTSTPQTVSGENTLSGVVIPRGIGTGTGIIPITWTVTDLNNQTKECTFNLTLEDHEGPMIIVPGNSIRYTDAGVNTYTVQGTEFDYVETFDNCGIVVRRGNSVDRTTFNGLVLQYGLNTITWYAEDDKGNHSEQSFNITVLDNKPPTLKIPAANTSAEAIGACVAKVNYTVPVFEDNVSASDKLVITVSPSEAMSGADFPVGVTTVTYLVVDESGTPFSYSFDVTVTDTQSPTITCPAGSPFNKVTDPGKSYYKCTDNSLDPTFSDNCEVTIKNDYNNSSTLSLATFPVGTTTVIWTATDASGNYSECAIQVIVTDNQDPVIGHCPSSNIAQNADLGQCSFAAPGAEYDPYSFSDNNALSKVTYQIDNGSEVGTDLTTTLAGVPIPVGTTLSPTTTVTWRLYDASGRVSNTCTTVFTITDIEPPVIVTVPNQTRTTDAGQPDYTVKLEDAWDPVVSDNCNIQKITYKIDSGTENGTNTETTIVNEKLAVGTHTIYWKATDIHGLTSNGSYQVVVLDEEDPTVVCNNLTIQLDATGNYSLSETDIAAIAAGSADENGPVTLSVTPNVFDCTSVGENTVILTVTDKYGNESSCNTAKVTVQDVTPPTVECRAVTLYLDVLGNATVEVSDVNLSSSDVCGIDSYQISKDNTTFSDALTYHCSEVGSSNTIYLKVTDKNGKSSVCSTTATVKDEISPNAVCNPITVQLNASGNYTLSEANIDAIALGVNRQLQWCSDQNSDSQLLRLQ